MRESVIEAYLVKRVKDLDGIAFKFKSPGRRNVPDRIIVLPGARVDFIECKAPGEKPTDAQIREHARLIALGFPVAVIDSKDKVDDYVNSRR